MRTRPLKLAVYPRLRGDHVPRSLVGSAPLGLPPPARGSQHGVRLLLRIARSTPACAGITPGADDGRSRAEVYPRLRGDHPSSVRLCAVVGGLPPPARGSLAVRVHTERFRGSTPACAGITSGRRTARSRRRVYPRLRGDHTNGTSSHPSNAGLPPPARGSLFLLREYAARTCRVAKTATGFVRLHQPPSHGESRWRSAALRALPRVAAARRAYGVPAPVRWRWTPRA